MHATTKQQTPGNADFIHDYVRVDGQRIHCVSAGTGTPVLLIPGWPQTWYAWRHTMAALAANGFQAIAVDPPGSGHSDRPVAGYDTGTVANTLHRVMEQLGHAQYDVVGHDIGMWVGYALASDHPDAVTKLALTEAVIPGLAPAPPIFVAPADNIFLWHFMFNQVNDLPEMLTAGKEREYINFIFDKWSYRRDRVAVDVYADAYATPGALRAGFAYYRAIPETIRQNTLRAKTRLSMPVLALGAEHATQDAPLVTMKDNASDLQGAIIADSGHFVMEENHDAFIGHLLPFLKQGR
ncbi:alpha/beta fold hydrolase [Janthinobacterium fluminis]|uniref:Alpha/beta hydrolase n=1 Tax=Janthinobacterium fluminis TaxID=2987524 RepID=A0ABT5K764_9BURK|nr:alpha/beta hydrolase [Janthinobacterium fluminis]MDC8760853.1 alpha/beta hydrolase [Janthinobacterium fluminis]